MTFGSGRGKCAPAAVPGAAIAGVMELPDVVLPRAGGGSVTRADLAGRPWLVYLSRHPG